MTESNEFGLAQQMMSELKNEASNDGNEIIKLAHEIVKEVEDGKIDALVATHKVGGCFKALDSRMQIMREMQNFAQTSLAEFDEHAKTTHELVDKLVKMSESKEKSDDVVVVD